MAHAVSPYPSVKTNRSVDLVDLARFAPNLFPDATIILSAISNHPEKFHLDPTDKVYGVELAEAPTEADDGVKLSLNAFVQGAQNTWFFRKYALLLQGDPHEVSEAEVLEEVPLASTHFRVRVGLMQRKAIFEDKEHGIRKIYPLGVGGIDQGLLSSSHGQLAIMTPTFTGAVFERRRVIAQRTDPPNYKGLPFAPITTQRGTPTPIAFHIIQHPQLVRGFDSHGCMRLRKKDLMEFFYVLTRGGSAKVPIDISLNLPEADDHPYPFRDNGFMTVRNCAGPGEMPHSCRNPDEHNLIEMVDVRQRPPFEQLQALNADAMTKHELSELEGGLLDEGMGDGQDTAPVAPIQLIDKILHPSLLLEQLFGNSRQS